MYNRRQVLAGGVLGGAAVMGLGKMGSHVRSTGAASIERALQVKAASNTDMSAVKHVVFLMQENRSFDHYFGTMKGVRGFADTNNSSAFTQSWPGGASADLLPFHMNTKKQQAECTYDLSHAWTAEHASWDNGTMGAFVSTHTSDEYEGNLGTVTMGYYEKADIPFYFDLAAKFTICDNYFCSVLGPTHPNRLIQQTGMLDPTGENGGPIIVTNSSQTDFQGTCTWETMPDVLSANNITWKCYNPYGSNYQPGASYFFSKNMLLYFDQYANASPTSAAYQNAFSYYGPNVTGGATSQNPNMDDFTADVTSGNLPQVSWIMSPDSYDEHPPAPALLGEWYTKTILDILTSNEEVWASTVLFIMYDENDGFFDHVPPPTAPSTPTQTPGEYLTVDPLPSAAGGIAGPIGLGVRVPMIVVSPFSAGGWVCHDVLDHTSQLQFLGELFDVPVPNVSAWRTATVGNLTNTLPNLSTPKTKVPKFPKVSDDESIKPISTECTSAQIIELNPTPAAPIAPPTVQSMPKQKKGSLKTTA
jgi:phospholipase C